MADYSYDHRGNRIHETLTSNGTTIREQSNTYNSRGWFTGVNTSAIDQPINVTYRFDAAGNRVAENDNLYTFDANNRMASVYNVEKNLTVSSIEYDGFGNRVSQAQGSTTTTYVYDKLNRVKVSSAGDVWTYDGVGNNLSHSWQGGWTTSSYDAERRQSSGTSVGSDGKATYTAMYYDKAGTLGVTRISSSEYGFDEVALYDVRSKNQYKYISGRNNWVKDAKYLYGNDIPVRRQWSVDLPRSRAPRRRALQQGGELHLRQRGKDHQLLGCRRGDIQRRLDLELSY